MEVTAKTDTGHKLAERHPGELIPLYQSPLSFDLLLVQPVDQTQAETRG